MRGTRAWSANRELPSALRAAIDAVATGVPLRELREAAARLSGAYRESTRKRSVYLQRLSDIDRLAYVTTRMPSTYASIRMVLLEFRERCPTLEVGSLLDVGSGPATGLWATSSVFSELSRATLVEPVSGMRELGNRLLSGSLIRERVNVTWAPTTSEQLVVASPFDVVLAAYVTNELPSPKLELFLDTMWDACRHAVLLVEPGSPAGFERIIAARAHLMARGATIVAPCPHADVCPLLDEDVDWCHFAARLNRTSLQRRLKGGTLAYEDEPYSYVIATREIGERVAGRVIRRPRTRSGQVFVRVCAGDGVKDKTITRRQGPIYHLARKLRWGDSWD